MSVLVRVGGYVWRVYVQGVSMSRGVWACLKVVGMSRGSVSMSWGRWVCPEGVGYIQRGWAYPPEGTLDQGYLPLILEQNGREKPLKTLPPPRSLVGGNKPRQSSDSGDFFVVQFTYELPVSEEDGAICAFHHSYRARESCWWSFALSATLLKPTIARKEIILVQLTQTILLSFWEKKTFSSLLWNLFIRCLNFPL